MEGRSFQKCGFRIGTARIPRQSCQQLQSWRAPRFQNAASAPDSSDLMTRASARIGGSSYPK
eukprot:3485611-Pyramimonas_sp.AAC.1